LPTGRPPTPSRFALNLSDVRGEYYLAHGAKDATVDERQIEAWAAQWQSCNWAVATGSESGVFVLDVDGDVGLYERQSCSLPVIEESTARKAGAAKDAEVGRSWLDGTDSAIEYQEGDKVEQS
jgi:hypothetical protein